MTKPTTAPQKSLLASTSSSVRLIDESKRRLEALLDGKKPKRRRISKTTSAAPAKGANAKQLPSSSNPSSSGSSTKNVLQVLSLSDLPGFKNKPLTSTTRRKPAPKSRNDGSLMTMSSFSTKSDAPSKVQTSHAQTERFKPETMSTNVASTVSTATLDVSKPTKTSAPKPPPALAPVVSYNRQSSLSISVNKKKSTVKSRPIVDKVAASLADSARMPPPESRAAMSTTVVSSHSKEDGIPLSEKEAMPPPSHTTNTESGRIDSVLREIPKPEKSAESTAARQKTKPSSGGNFVRLNLRNSGGSCRGTRNKKFKKEYGKYKRGVSNEDDGLGTSSSSYKNASATVVSQSGIDPVDDFLDGVYTQGQKRSKKSRQTQSVIPICSGHQLACKLLTVKKTGANKGRQFYCCSLSRGEQCNHFQWADDTIEAAQAALMKNTSHSCFIARQVGSYMDQIKALTVPELRDLASRHNLDTKGKKPALVARLSIWVRNEIATGLGDRYSKEEGTSQDVGGDGDLEDTDGDVDISMDESESAVDSESEDDDSSDEELELVGEESNSRSKTETTIQDNKDPLHSALKSLFGYSKFRDGQAWAIRRCMAEQRTLLVAPTGFGKSMCYALPSALLEGVCIVVSPLISLIQDQLRTLPPRLPAVTLSGQLSTSKMAATLDDIFRGRIKIVFVSPERLASPSFRRMFRLRWNPETSSYERQFPVVSLLCVDEAHCVSFWSHNFRPSYLRLRSVIDLVQPKSILAITATAGPRVVSEICRTLNIPSAVDNTDGSEDASQTAQGVRVMKPDRDNIDVSCFVLSTQEERLSVLISILSPKKSKKTQGNDSSRYREGCLSSGSVIVYVWRQRDAEAVAENIQAAGVPGGVVVYHGGMSAADREKAQSKFMRGKARVCVATVAFGLGINKCDIEGVIHTYLSSSPEHFLQETGRCGRDGRSAQAIALILRDEVLVRHSLSHSDSLATSQVKSLLCAIAEDVRDSYELLGQSRQTVNVSLPLRKLSNKCDCKAETIETVVSLLELREGSAPLLQVEGLSYDSATIAPIRRRLCEIAAKEPVAKAILDCGVCIDAPAGERKGDEHKEESFFRGSDLAEKKHMAGHSFGSYSLSVSKCANLLGPTAEPRHVFAALRRLQSAGEIDYSLDTSDGGRALHLSVTREGMEVFGSEGDDRLDELTNEMVDKLSSTLDASATKVLDINHILFKVSEVSGDSVHNSGAKSESLTVFQRLVTQYFDEQGCDSLATSPDYLPSFAPVPSKQELSMTLYSVQSQLTSLEASMAIDKGYVELADRSFGDYLTLSTTKFLHGLATARFPHAVLQHNASFGSLQRTRFHELYKAIADLQHDK